MTNIRTNDSYSVGLAVKLQEHEVFPDLWIPDPLGKMFFSPLALPPDFWNSAMLKWRKTMKSRYKILAVLGLVFFVGMQTIAGAQGRGGGRGQGGPPAGNPSTGRQPTGVGVDRGINTSSEKSGGWADTGRGTASDSSNGRSDAGLERARLQRENARRANEELEDHPQMPTRLHTTANDLRSGYEAALLANPKLTFGQYVAATRLAANLGATRPAITTDAILAGLGGGKSIGRTLQDLGLSEQDSSAAKKQAEREIKEAKRR
jgi:hypothetical protein